MKISQYADEINFFLTNKNHLKLFLFAKTT